MNLTAKFKETVITELRKMRTEHTGDDYTFSNEIGIPSNKWNVLNRAEFPLRMELAGATCISDSEWLRLGRMLNVNLKERKWNVARTEVFTQIEEDITFCKENAKSMVFVDECEIGKTFTAQYLAKTLPNCFYVDCSECKTRKPFIVALARAIGVSTTGAVNDIKANIKYCLQNIEKPVIIIDEAGDLEYEAFLNLKELWNATDGYCGFYMMGADGLKAKIERGISNQKVGYREIFSRYSGKFSKVSPINKEELKAFHKQLLTTVITANCEDKKLVAELVNKCMKNDVEGIAGLRRAESLLILLNKK